MEGFESILLLVLVVMAVAPLARRLDVPLPIMLVLAGLGLSAAPRLAGMKLDPDLVFLVFVPPLLYWSCITASMRDLRRMRREIGMLAVGAVVATITAVALASHYAAPHLSWPAAVTLGAIVSPPDAAVTIVIARRLGLPRYLVSLLEGETLFNDVAAFTAYRLAVVAAMTGYFSIWHIGPRLLYTALAAFAVGWLVAQAVIWLRRRIRDPIVANTLSLMTAYAAYLPAEWLGSSGVIAVVTVGLILGRIGPRLVDPQTRIQAQQVWPVVLFILNGLIFLLIGLQIGVLGQEMIHQRESAILLPALGISLLVIVVRVVFVLATREARRWMDRRAPSARRWGETLFVAWTGIRGGDTLVTALAIPLSTADGSPFPGRHAIIVIAFGVIVVTLVLQGATLRPLIRRFTIPDQGSEADEERLARRELSQAGVDRLREIALQRRLPEEIRKQIQIHHHMRRHVRSGSEQQPENVESSILASQLLDINSQVLKAERERVLRLRDAGTISEEVFRGIMRELDLEELVMMRKADEV